VDDSDVENVAERRHNGVKLRSRVKEEGAVVCGGAVAVERRQEAVLPGRRVGRGVVSSCRQWRWSPCKTRLWT
jgi:hypothetical protein